MKKMVLSLTCLSAIAFGQTSFAACPTGTSERPSVTGKPACALTQKEYTNMTLTLTNGNDYLLETGVFIGGDNTNPASLVIQAGTKILGTEGAFIVISRGSKIVAQGTQAAPIVFTSKKLTDRKRGEWGGLVINGRAPINVCNGAGTCEAVSEGIKERTVKFGGADANDNSGVLKYVVVEFAGYEISKDNELNGITFNAVGRGTTVENIQVHMNADDGIEFFGGTVNVKYAVLTANDDDSIDWDFGWTGKAQFLLALQADDKADNGIEADNLKSPMNASPRSNPTISNMTLVGGKNSGFGMLLRKGTGANLSNVIVTGFKKACVNVDDEETFLNGGAGRGTAVTATGLRMSHSILSCTAAFDQKADDLWSIESWFNAQAGNRVGNAGLSGYMPVAGSPALSGGVTPEDIFFDPVDYIGAFETEDWTTGWTQKSLK